MRLGLIRGKHLNSGIRGGLWDRKHYERMGSAIWLFGWLVHRQTTQRMGDGKVLWHRALTYEQIAEDTGYARHSIERWMQQLREGGYIRVKHTTYKRMIVTVLNAKKFASNQAELLGMRHEIGTEIVAADLRANGSKSGGSGGGHIQQKRRIVTAKVADSRHRAEVRAEKATGIGMVEKSPEQQTCLAKVRELAGIKTMPQPMTDAEIEERRKVLREQARQIQLRQGGPIRVVPPNLEKTGNEIMRELGEAARQGAKP